MDPFWVGAERERVCPTERKKKSSANITGDTLEMREVLKLLAAASKGDPKSWFFLLGVQEGLCARIWWTRLYSRKKSFLAKKKMSVGDNFQRCKGWGREKKLASGALNLLRGDTVDFLGWNKFRVTTTQISPWCRRHPGHQSTKELTQKQEKRYWNNKQRWKSFKDQEWTWKILKFRSLERERQVWMA